MIYHLLYLWGLMLIGNLFWKSVSKVSWSDVYDASFWQSATILNVGIYFYFAGF